MRRFQKPEDEKRSLVILHEQDYDAWLACTRPDLARSFLKLFPAQDMWAQSAVLSKPQTKSNTAQLVALPIQKSLFDE